MVKLRYFLLVIILIMSCGIVSADALTLLSNWSCINSSTGFVASAMGAASKDPIGGYYYLVTGGDKDSVARIYISPDGVTWYNHPNFTPGTNPTYLGAATEVYAD